MRMKTCNTKKDFQDRIFDILEFCQEAVAQESNPEIIKNMDHRFWATNEHCLLNLIYIQKRFRNKDGCLQLLYDKKRVIGVSGVDKYNSDIAIIGKRFYVLKKYRADAKKAFFPVQIKWSEKHNMKAVLFTVNEHNKRILKMVQILTKRARTTFPVIGKFQYLGKREINNCNQDVFYYKIDKRFDLNAVL